MVGIVLAGLISAILSSVDSTLNSASTLVVVDFIKTRKPDITDKETVNYGRITTVVLMVVAALWAPFIGNFGGIWAYLQQMFSIIVPPIAVIFLVGVFYKRGNGHGAFWTLIIGTAGGVLLFALAQLGIWSLHFTYNIGIMVSFSTLVFILVSNITSPPTKEALALTYRPSLMSEDTQGLPWFKDYRYQLVVLIACILITLYMFW